MTASEITDSPLEMSGLQALTFASHRNVLFPRDYISFPVFGKSQHLIQNENLILLEVSVALAMCLLSALVVCFRFEVTSAEITVSPDISQ